MNLILLIQCTAIGLIGLAIHVLLRLQKMKQLALKSNVTFSVNEYFKQESLSLIISLLVLIVSVMGIDELINWQPYILKFVKWFFLVIGFAGDNIVFAFLSKTEKWLLEKIDRKTNIADGITENLTTNT